MQSFRDQQNQKHTEPQQETLQEAAERLGRLSPDQLTATLYSEVAKAKRQGTLKEGDLARFCESVAPLLTEEQNASLAALVRQLQG